MQNYLLLQKSELMSTLFNISEELLWVFSLYRFYICAFLQVLAEFFKYFLLKFNMKYRWMTEKTRSLKSKVDLYKCTISTYSLAHCHILDMLYNAYVVRFSSNNYIKQTEQIIFLLPQNWQTDINCKPKLL